MKRGIIIGLFLMLSLSANAQYFENIKKENDKNARVSSIGSPRVLTVLVEFEDVPFVTKNSKDYFSGLLNKKARKYFDDNSSGLFIPQFDVVGPVKIGKMARYGTDIIDHGQRVTDTAPDEALADACKLLEKELDFSKYDSDGDGIIDLVIFYYAGFDQSAGGPDDAIWSHHQDIQEISPSGIRDMEFDGKRLGFYICVSELQGNKGKDPAGIGPAVHEMGHALGLPDFYDTNGATDGLAGGLYQFSPMCRGGYNDDGATPPYFNAIERILLGWMGWDDLIPLDEEGWMNLRPVQFNQAAFSYTKTEGEYFIYECRSGSGWDSTLSAGLLVYHLDCSDRIVENGSGLSAFKMWKNWRWSNNLNNLYKHPCFYIVPPMAPQDFNYAPSSNPATLVFPGAGEVHDFVAYDWDYENTGTQITCIDYVNEKEGARFRVLFDEKPKVTGLVLEGDSSAPIQGAIVRLESEKGEVLSKDKTGMDGYFQLPLGIDLKKACSQSLYLVVECEDYRTVREEIRMDSDGLLCRYVNMFSIKNAASDRLYKYDPALSSGYFSADEPLIGAVRFKASELAGYSGNRLASVVIYPYKTPSDEEPGTLFITVDMGEKEGSRVLTFPVEKLKDKVTGNYRPLKVDLRDVEIRVPEGLDMYVGYGCDSPARIFPLSGVYPGTEGNSYYTPFGYSAKGWTPMYLNKAEMYMDLMLDIVVEEVHNKDLAFLGYAYILSCTQPEYKAGEILKADLAFPKVNGRYSLSEWTLDGEALDSTEFVLKEGKHTLEAHLIYEDGREEYVSKDLKVLPAE